MSKQTYRTYQIWIKPGHRLYAYAEQMCQDAKNLYNTTNFYIRQVFTALRQDKPLQPLQQQVMDTLLTNIGLMNVRQLEAHQARLQKQLLKPADQRKDSRCHLFELPTKASPYVDYPFLDCLFKTMEQADYRALPAQCSQWVMKRVFSNWQSFFASITDYRVRPDKYAGRPHIPGYARTKTKEVVFTNQDCEIKDRKYLKLPKTKQRLNIGKLGYTEGDLKQVRIVPKYGQYVVELVFACPVEATDVAKENALAIDLGIDQLATIVTNTDHRPVCVKGKPMKAINQYYNKLKAHYTGILRQGKQPQEGAFSSKRLNRLHLKRHRRIKDLFHKTSHYIVRLAAEQKIGTIVIGYNQGWKVESDMGRSNNQSFCYIPHQMLVSMIRYKAAALGIEVILTEEAYTSKVSFLDHDPLPKYEEGVTRAFSGKRIHRGLYRSRKGLIHADVNGAANIMRKVFPKASANGIAGLVGSQSVNVSTPLMLSIQ
ncbi:putative transposase [Paenibacillus uliginis N3/975]|uniref:Putative transposase n=1 Tax=Paenibacillus uliginis N3/975 TaxID=1313296 RepID=A0A1X7GQ49_9BACL|nr:RNA-guided endonuclease TnpB family protein [Paenibacillus uliginis]SMF72303.1 putative transposase [Paenibacillus uliginis N3/975]